MRFIGYLIDRAVDHFVVRREAITHPFDFPVVTDGGYDTQEDQHQADNTTTQRTLWGGRVVDAVVTETEDSISYDLELQKSKLKPSDLDEFDLAVIKQWNDNPRNAKRLIIPANYRLVKPYVLSEHKYTYEEIGVVLNKSERWVQHLGPRIKEAAKLRREAKPPTLQEKAA